jgi:hypothetical protein
MGAITVRRIDTEEVDGSSPFGPTNPLSGTHL